MGGGVERGGGISAGFKEEVTLGSCGASVERQSLGTSNCSARSPEVTPGD